jgi:hypothetical protein
MMSNGFIRVNIHNKGRIPWLNIQGPRYNISVSATIYRMLREDARVIVHPVDNDPVMEAKAKKESEPIITKTTVQPEVKLEEETLIPEPETEDVDVIIEENEDLIEEHEEPVSYEEQPIMQILEPDEDDLAIDQALEDFPEDEEEDLIITEDELGEEIQEILTVTIYTEDELLQLTKEQLKVILNKDRGFEPGTEFYGRYHDNHDVLVSKVLNSQ